MIFTLYYMYATFLQWWRLGALKNKLNGTLNTQNALLVCDEKVMYDLKRKRSLENLLFRNDNRIGCTILPKQKINLSSQWVSFPSDFRHFPIFFEHVSHKIDSPNIYILIQAFLDTYNKHQSEILQLENFGDLIAWRVADEFEAILKTDMDKLTKLVHCFSQNNCDINHELQLLRIETVNVEGTPKKIKYVKKFPTDVTLRYSYASNHWKHFVSEIKNIYSRVRDVTNPKITIENGTPKPDEVKKVPVSEVKPIKKSDDKNTLEVTSSDYRRHKTNDHTKRDKEKSSEKHKKDHTKRETEKQKQQAEATTSKTKTHHLKNKRVSASDKSLKKERKTEKEEEEATSKTKTKEDHGKLAPEGRTSSKEKKLVKTPAICEPVEETDVKPKEKRSENKIKENFKGTNGSVVMADGLGRIIKPPNVLVYAESVLAKENVKSVLSAILNREKYTVYDLPLNHSMWDQSTVLVIVCGNVPPNLTFNLLQYLLDGGQLLCLCSDLLYSVLHTFTTAEVREHELVRFSYGEWKQVKMMHHIFCYQASPAKKQFSKDSDTSNQSSGSGSSPIAPVTPSTVEIQHNGKEYTIQVQVLGTEETWQTPSLLSATIKGSKGRAIFSQVHLEIDPNQYEADENKFEALKDSDAARLEILRDILASHLDVDCQKTEEVVYTPAYFLGKHDSKLKMLSDCECIKDNKMASGDVTVTFCGKNQNCEKATENFLPVLIHSCPSNFSTVSYFEALETEHIGRLVLFSDVMKSSQSLINDKVLTHGLVVIPRQQTHGVGRSNNCWISPPGCAMFSLQLHVSLDSALGRTLPLVQHLIMAAAVAALKNIKELQNVDIGIKWPNDLYANKNVKIGGLLANSFVSGELCIVNVGCAINLDNSNPTVCLNDLIKSTNEKNAKRLEHETYFALVFNEIEKMIVRYQNGDKTYFFDTYHKFWLHSDSSVNVMTEDGATRNVKVVGIDDFGFLKVMCEDGRETSVQPDGNSFDMMRGLISPKTF